MTGLTLLVCSMMVPAQTSQKAAASHAAKPAAPIFEPLERWKNAVLAGDHATLATLYAAMPGAFAQTPQGRSSDPEAEADFWGRLHARGLQAFNPKILQMDTRQPGVVVLTLRIELTMLGGGTTEKPERSVASATQVWVHQSAGWQIYRSQRGVFVDRPAMRLPEPTRRAHQFVSRMKLRGKWTVDS